MSEELPPGWTTGTIEELAGDGGLMTDGDWIESKDQDPSGGVRLIQLADVGDGEFLDRSSRFLNDATASRLRCTFLQPGDVLIARMPDPLGRACVYPGVEKPAVTAVDVCIWRPGKRAADPRWLMHIINSAPVRGELANLASGTTRQRVSGGNLKRFSLPVPPLAEQRRIVARIEALFARTRTARAHLLRVIVLCEKYRARAIAAPFESEGAAAWPRFGVGEIVADARIGLVRSREEQSTAGGAPYVRMQHYDHYGRWNADKLTFVSVSAAEAAAYELRESDVLFNTRNSTELVGKVALWPSGKAGHVYNNNLLRLRFRQGVSPAFVRWSLVGSDAAAALHAAKSATTSVAAIYQRDLMGLKIGIPTKSEQERIAASVAASLLATDQTEHEASRALALLDHLERSILEKAFRGELVPQDPADEPAAVPLARVATAPAAPRRRGRTPRAA